MAKKRKATDYGLRQATQLCSMARSERMQFIAEGLPIILESAQSLVRASQALEKCPREAEILEGHAEEECAKILILIDIVRCPASKVSARCGPMMKWFYNHLARLIYAKAQSWKPMTATQLQEYVDTNRNSHYLEGEYGEYIAPNWELFRRESSLYADAMGTEDGTPVWISPIRHATGLPALVPISFRTVEALSAFGIFSIAGLEIVADVWNKIDVTGDIPWSITRDLYGELVERLESAGLITEGVTSDHARALVSWWQLPMYNIDFSQINVPLEDLLEQREADLPYSV